LDRSTFVISLISQEKVDFIISHVDNARTLVTCREAQRTIDSASFATELNTLTRVDYESPRDQIRVRPDVELSVNAGFLEHWKAYTTVLNRDVVPVRIIINARTVFPRETEKERMAEDTFRNMVGDAGAGKFKHQTRWSNVWPVF
jgi:hypothetical protein